MTPRQTLRRLAAILRGREASPTPPTGPSTGPGEETVTTGPDASATDAQEILARRPPYF